MKAKLALLVGFFLLTPFFLFSLIALMLALHDGSSEVATKPQAVAYSTSEAPIGITTQVDAEEARVDVLKEFFARYNSPLEDYSSQIVAAADKYGLDYRLIPAIAMQESILCRRIPKDSYNCWGFGIHGGEVKKFSDFGQAIETVTKTLATEYHAKGLTQPAQIVSKYNPTNTNSWAENVSYVMDRIALSL